LLSFDSIVAIAGGGETTPIISDVSVAGSGVCRLRLIWLATSVDKVEGEVAICCGVDGRGVSLVVKKAAEGGDAEYEEDEGDDNITVAGFSCSCC
jgi:hypothetical protein